MRQGAVRILERSRADTMSQFCWRRGRGGGDKALTETTAVAAPASPNAADAIKNVDNNFDYKQLSRRQSFKISSNATETVEF